MIEIHFLPDDVKTQAKPGESWLTVAQRAGVSISTGCIMGSCRACEIEVEGIEEPVMACLETVPHRPTQSIEVNLLSDPTW
jgi:ferredoxin